MPQLPHEPCASLAAGRADNIISFLDRNAARRTDHEPTSDGHPPAPLAERDRDDHDIHRVLDAGEVDLRSILADLEQSYITAALHRTDYTVSEAARLLGLQRTTLCEKIRRYEISRDAKAVPRQVAR